MALSLLPNLVFPITGKQVHALMDNLVQLNALDAGLSDRDQKALDIVLDTYEIKAKTNGLVDYTGDDGHARLFQDAMIFCGDGNPVVTRHGDLRAAHLAIAYNNAQVCLKNIGMPALTDDRNELVRLARKITVLPLRTEERMGLFLSYLDKKKI